MGGSLLGVWGASAVHCGARWAKRLGSARERAASVLQDASSDAQSAAKILQRYTDPFYQSSSGAEENISITSVQAAQDYGLSAFYKGLKIGQPATLGKAAGEAATNLVGSLKRWLADVFEPTSLDTSAPGRFFRSLKVEGESVMNAKLRDAMDKATAIIHILDPHSTSRAKEEASSYAKRIIYEHQEAIWKETKKKNKEIWAKLGNADATTEHSKRAVTELVANLHVGAKPSNIPIHYIRHIGLDQSVSAKMRAEVREPLLEAYPDIFQARAVFSDLMDMQTLQKVRSNVLEDARKARRAGDQELAHNLDLIADGLMRDLEASAKGDKWKRAVAHTREMHKTFTHPDSPGRKVTDLVESGRVLISDAEIDVLMGELVRTGPKSRVFLDQLAAVDHKAYKDAVDVIQTKFAQDHISDGRINIAGAKKFLSHERGHGAVLETMPHLRLQIEDAIRKEEAFILQKKGVDAFRSRKHRTRAVAQRWIDDDPKVAAQSVLNSRNSLADAKRLMRLVNRGSAPVEAREGIQRAFYELFEDKLGVLDHNGIPYVKAQEWVDAHRKALEEVFDARQMKVIDDIMSIARKVAEDAAVMRAPGSDTASNINMVHMLAARIIGASVGRKAGQLVGGGTIQSAWAGSGAATLLLGNIKAGKVVDLLEQAFFDKKLMAELLTKDLGQVPIADLPLVRAHLFAMEQDERTFNDRTSMR